jgi:hypothetical protein
MVGCDLDITQVHAGVQHGRDEGMAQHMRVRPGDSDPSCISEPPQAAGRGMAGPSGRRGC